MKHLLLFTLLIIAAITSNSQLTFNTAQTGSWSVAGTWVGAQAPPTTGNCNCKIVIKPGHMVTLNTDVNINTVALVLEGAGSILTFGTPNNRLLVLGGTSSIDLQNATASITGSKAGQTITLGGQQIYQGNTTMFNSATPGVVNGLASAASVRTSPQFQSGTLPVVLSDFNVSEKGSGVALSWKTQTEVNSSHFVIERSTDNKQWNAIGTVQAGGNISVEQNYSFTDPAPADGTNYYRLRIVDIDNVFKYSLIKTASFKATELMIVTGPNPATSYLNINVSTPGNQPYRLRLVNRSGQVVYDRNQAAATTRLQLNVSNYADGTYFVEVSNSSGLRKINQVMILRK